MEEKSDITEEQSRILTKWSLLNSEEKAAVEQIIDVLINRK